METSKNEQEQKHTVPKKTWRPPTMSKLEVSDTKTGQIYSEDEDLLNNFWGPTTS
jgi:hypothetical protein